MCGLIGHLFNVLSAGCRWRYVREDSALQCKLSDYSDFSSYDRAINFLHHALYIGRHENLEREASFGAGIIFRGQIIIGSGDKNCIV